MLILAQSTFWNLLTESLKGWKLDLTTMVITVLISPFLLFLLKILLRYLKNWGGYLLEGGLYWLSRSFKRSLAGAMTLKRYCRLQLSGSSKYLYVPSRQDAQLEIDKVYVTLTLERQGGEQSKYSHDDIVSAGNRIRVIGDPGSGKSSLIKRLFRDSCIKAIKSPAKSRLPILLELKNLKIPTELNDSRLGDWLYTQLQEDAERMAVYQMAECFNTYAQTAGLLLLLDGLDEVSTSDYLRVQKAILQLSNKLALYSDKTVIILTMRTQFHQQIKDSYRDDFAQALFLSPFSPSDIYKFLMRWPFKEKPEHHVARIYKELTDRPTLREMCSNPLVLSMYVAEDQAVGHLIAPESRTEFYSKVTEELIFRRRLKQTGHTAAVSALREQRERILGRLAYEHLLDSDQPANSLPWSAAVRVVREVLKCTEAEAEATFRELAKETGLVTEERPQQTFRFIHLTFCEFLAAFEAIQGRQDGWDTIIQTHKKFQRDDQPQLRSRLAEVIPFSSGLLPRVNRHNALTEVTKLQDSRLTAFCFLETKLYEHEAWSKFAESERAALSSTPEEQWDEQWLRRLHLFNVVVSDAASCSNHMPSITTTVDLTLFFETLVGKQRSSLATLLSAYASQDAAAAFRLAEICKINIAENFPDIVINHCDQFPFFSLVKEQIHNDNERAEVWVCLLVEAALRFPIVAQWLLDSEQVDNLSKYRKCVAKKKNWEKSRLFRTKKITYLRYITIAVNSGYKDNSITMLTFLRCLVVPRSFHFSLALLLLAMIGASATLPLNISKGNALVKSMFLFFIIIGIPYTLLLVQITLRYICQRLLNIPPRQSSSLNLGKNSDPTNLASHEKLNIPLLSIAMLFNGRIYYNIHLLFTHFREVNLYPKVEDIDPSFIKKLKQKYATRVITSLRRDNTMQDSIGRKNFIAD
jgi:hypothetical protein